MEEKEKDTPVTDETQEAAPEVKEESAEERLARELAEMNDKYLRMLAEYENYRRRSQKERQSVYADAVCDTLKKILPIADNLARASAAVGDAEAVRKGLSMTEKALADLLTAFGAEAFGVRGEQFDPNLHNAVLHEDNPDLPENTISDVFECGYRMGEKIIRYAMVKVAN
jgi:molecular chaperone GrpE